MRTLAVVGGGVIGLSAAWRAAGAGFTVTLFDPAVGSGSSWVAGGMLAPLSEGWPGEDEALAFGAASLTRWPGFAAELKAITGTDVFVADETLTVALDAADAADLRTIADWVNARGHALRVLDRAGVREAEPSLGRTVRAGLLAASEPAVDNRALVGALRTACVAAGVEFRAERVESPAELPHDRVVLATGAAAAELWPGLPIRPVKGEILRLRRRPSAPTPPRRVIRARVHGRPVYLVPRADGIVLGATQYEVGFDSAVTVAGVRDLVTDAESVLPGLGEYEFAEAVAGYRPGSPDNLPLIGYLDDRVIVAAGHGRNGILDTPVTADAVLALLDDTELPEAAPANPARFTGAPDARHSNAHRARQSSAAAPLHPGGVR